MDFNHDRPIFHNDQTKAAEGKFCSVLTWRDKVGLLELHG